MGLAVLYVKKSLHFKTLTGEKISVKSKWKGINIDYHDGIFISTVVFFFLPICKSYELRQYSSAVSIDKNFLAIL